jgi:hypothetical protein
LCLLAAHRGRILSGGQPLCGRKTARVKSAGRPGLGALEFVAVVRVAEMVNGNFNFNMLDAG